MSRTYRKTFRGKYTTQGKLNAERRKKPRHVSWIQFMSTRSSRRDWLCQSNMPSHWAREYHTKPRRAKERDLLTKLLKNECDADDVVFPDGKKPVIYYW
jgi:hypothetical protein